jgi:hypothetical protein
MGYNIVVNNRSILHGYFNPLVFCYQWEYLLTSKEFIFFAGYIRLAMYNGQSWICLSVTIGIFPLYIYKGYDLNYLARWVYKWEYASLDGTS